MFIFLCICLYLYRCEFCERYTNSNEREKKLLIQEREDHKANKTLARQWARESKEEAASDPSIVVIHFDLQKVLSTPRCQVSNLYYMSKLTVYNLTFYNLESCSGTCNVWNETIARRGSNEIASLLINHLQDIISKNAGIKEIRTVSDNCGGQNRNQNVFTMMLRFAVLHNVKITHR